MFGHTTMFGIKPRNVFQRPWSPVQQTLRSFPESLLTFAGKHTINIFRAIEGKFIYLCTVILTFLSQHVGN